MQGAEELAGEVGLASRGAGTRTAPDAGRGDDAGADEAADAGGVSDGGEWLNRVRGRDDG